MDTSKSGEGVTVTFSGSECTIALTGRYSNIIETPLSLLTEVDLASASPRRRELLSSLGLDVIVVPSGYEERALPGRSPADVARIHARGKAAGAAARPGARLVVAADTVVDVDGDALGKPADCAEAATMIRRLSGRSHVVHTAFVAAVPETGLQVERCETTLVTFARLSDAEIAAYANSGDGLDKAGGYGIQGRGAALVARIEGDFYTVMGFPLGVFVRALPALGYALETHPRATLVGETA